MSPVAPTTVLEVRDLVRHFPAGGGRKVHAVNGVSLHLQAGEVLAVVGESGCGKSTLGRLIMRLDRPDSGQIVLEGDDISALPASKLKALRPRIQMIFQDPGTSLDPRWTVGQCVQEPLDNYAKGSRAERRARVEQLLVQVGLRADHAERYPHELSGGQRQRVAIARALVLSPRIILADEPVSALDVSVRAQVINLLSDLRRSHGLSLVFISHDIGVVAYASDRIAVMYLGRIVEIGPTRDILAAPRHPYTRALLEAVPVSHPARRRARAPLSGDPPSPVDLPPGCAFAARCPLCVPACLTAVPPLVPDVSGRAVACLRSHEVSP